MNTYKRIRKFYSVEHRLIMEKHIGRKLTKIEVVHHINGNKSDNRVENLQLLANRAEHNTLHAGKFCPKGHEYTKENTQLKGKNGNSRRCRECHRLEASRANKLKINQSRGK